MRTRKAYTALERKQLVQMVTQGKKDEEIAAIMGRTVPSIASKRITLFGAKKKYRKRRKQRVVRNIAPKVPKLNMGGGDLEITQRTLKALGYKLALIKLNKE